MKKKSAIITAIVVLIAAIVVLCIFGVHKLFDLQYYMETGVNSHMNVCIDDTQEREKIGELDGYVIYTEGVDPDKSYFTTISADTVTLRAAVEKKLVSVNDWKKKAWMKRKDGDAEVLIFENYEIALAYDECIIRPL